MKNGKLPRFAKLSLAASVVSLVLASGLYGVLFLNSSAPAPLRLSQKSFPLAEPTLRYGLALDTLSISVDTIQEGQTLSTLLTIAGVDASDIYGLSVEADSVMELRALRAGRTYTLVDDADTEGQDFFVYQPSVYEYVRLDLQGQGRTERVRLPVTTKMSTAGGRIESSLWNAMVGNGHSFELTDKMEDALKWSIDFYHVQPDESFKLVYEKEFVEGKEAGIGPVKAAYYHTASKDYYAFYYPGDKDGKHAGYYDLEGEPMKSTFLKAPLKYGRVSSSYNLRRFHPILKRTRPHYGTDYAAPYGTPIHSVADGVIAEAGRRGGNGNFVKVRHNQQYTTQYLHMQKFAEGIKPGVHVSQGDIIGYVGSTGLATGPHVCFRFWENGKQVDHTKIDFPTAEPLPDSLLQDFLIYKEDLYQELNGIEIPAPKIEEVVIDSTAAKP
ncbi:peptidase M23 [Lewinellaceae bacterium SD302]|nr:peptidase M23 [Lewinellaceae bacterium SD302]